jgi:hypothetical membrane protein
MRTLGTLAGIGAPASFIGAWVTAGAATPGYSAVRDHISDLAAVGAPTRPLMTAGLVGFGVLAPLFARSISTALDDPRLRTSITAAAVGTVGVAALPLGASWGNGPHAAAAAVSYVAMASTPILGSRALARSGDTGASRASLAAGLASAACLTASLVGENQGLLQRAGLTLVDAWFVVMAVRELRR